MAPWTGDQLVARALHTLRTVKQNKCKQISMPPVEIEPTASVFERENIVH
jgi:hypothetical protein